MTTTAKLMEPVETYASDLHDSYYHKDTAERRVALVAALDATLEGNSMTNEELARAIHQTHSLIMSTSAALQAYLVLVQHLKDLLKAQADRANNQTGSAV